MKFEPCDLIKIIPSEEVERVFSTGTASAELDFSFLAFEEVYKSVLSFVPKGKIIVDLGCAYAPQAFYFIEYAGYIGVDAHIPDVHFETPNMTLYNMSIQNFCDKVVKEGWNLEQYFAICSYVPDEEARKRVRETFPNCLVYYPSPGVM